MRRWITPIAAITVPAVAQSETQALDDRVSEPDGVRAKDKTDAAAGIDINSS
jgi:hypothetical protein